MWQKPLFSGTPGKQLLSSRDKTSATRLPERTGKKIRLARNGRIRTAKRSGGGGWGGGGGGLTGSLFAGETNLNKHDIQIPLRIC